MRKASVIELVNIKIIIGVLMSIMVFKIHATTYYVHPLFGSDDNPGTNEQAPLRTLAKASKLRLQPGDKLLLAAAQKFRGNLAFERLKGTTSLPIELSCYQAKGDPTTNLPLIDAQGNVAGICLKDCAHVRIANLDITANGGGMLPGQPVDPSQRCGILIIADQPGEYDCLTLTNIIIKDVFYEDPGFRRDAAETKTSNGTGKYGWGIRFINSTGQAMIKNILIADCKIENVSHTGLKFTAPHNGIQNVEAERVNVTHSGGPGVQMSGVTYGRFRMLNIDGSGSTNDTRNWKRGSGLWTWDCNRVVIENSRFQNANGPGDSAGVHIDYDCQNVIVQRNFSANNAGGFCEILGNNHNCAYRYNISVNDGYREKGKNGAMQEGKIFWLSGYVGDKKKPEGPFNTYFYNNTIYVRHDLTAKFSICSTAQGILIANNIFYIEGKSKNVMGDQTRSDSLPSESLTNVVFANNLFLRSDNWPADLFPKDRRPIIANPSFKKLGGLKPIDYTPQNALLATGHGMVISSIPEDQLGLWGGLTPDCDILGDPIHGPPGVGAIEVSSQAPHAGM